MINNFKRGKIVIKTDYRLCFDDGCNNGFGFPCDKDGNLLQSEMENPAAWENYRYCLSNPEKFFRFNKVVSCEHSWRENNTGTCHCGEPMELYNEYLGACECPKCGRWYNIWGQELNNPSTWSDGDDW